MKQILFLSPLDKWRNWALIQIRDFDQKTDSRNVCVYFFK